MIALESQLLTPGSGKLVEGELAPDFSYTLADGSTQRLSDLRGRPVLINFWASWCQPCVEEMPVLAQAYAEANGDLAILAVNRNELPEALARFASNSAVPLDFPLITNLSGDIGDRYGVTSLPVSYFINRDGRIVARHIGGLSATTLAERLAALQ